MEEQKWFQKLELSNSIIGTPSGLLTFLSKNTNTYMCSEDHGYVICTITDSKSCFVRVAASDQTDYVRFLLGRNTASQDDIDLVRNFQECFLQFIMTIDYK